MAYQSAREMLSRFPMKMAEGGSVDANQLVLDFITNNPDASVEAIATQINNSGADLYSLADTLNIDRSIAQEAYDEANALNQTYLDAETRVMGEINANPAAFNAADAYSEILKADAASERGVNVQGALDAGVAQSTIDRIFTTPAGSQAYTGPAPTATMSAGVQDYYNTVMADGEVDAAERLAMQKIATDQGLSYNDILAAGVDPNILYNTPAAAAAPTTKVCPIGTLKAGQTIDINGDCGVLPALPTGLTDAEKAAQLAASQAAFTNTQEEYVAPTVYQPLPDNTSVYAAGEESLDRTFRDSAPRTEIIDAYGGLVDFDYSPGASLTSATGSGYNFTPPTVTNRPRSLMGADQLGRYNRGRSAADLRQLTTGLGSGRTYSDYAGALENPGSYSGGLSKSQLYSRMRGLDYQLDAAAAADRQASTTRGGISAYLAANPDIAASYESQKDRLGAQSLEQFARNHYNTTGRAEMAANKRGDFILVESTGGGGVDPLPRIDYGSGFGEGDEESRQQDYTTSNFEQAQRAARSLGEAGEVYRPFAQGGSVKKPKGFADGGTASADLKILNNYAGGGIIDKAIQKGAAALGFDDERQVAISEEAVELTNQMVDAGLISEQYRVELLMPENASQRTRQNTGIKGDEEVFNAVNHALFAYDAGQSTLGAMGAQAKELYQGLNRKMGGSDPRSEYLDYFNNKFGFNLAEQGLSRQEAKNAIMDTLGNINNQGTRGRMTRGEPIKAGVDLLTNVQDAKYPWE